MLGMLRDLILRRSAFTEKKFPGKFFLRNIVKLSEIFITVICLGNCERVFSYISFYYFHGSVTD